MDEQYNECHEEWDRQEEHAACVNGAVTADTCEETQECAKRAKELYPDDFDACNEKGGIRAGTYELCAYDVANTMFLYDSVPAYFHWARLVAYTK